MARWLPDSSQAELVHHLRSVNNLSGLEGRLVRFSAGVVPASSTTSGCLGVLADGGEASAVNVAIATDGIMEVILGDSVSPGDWLVPDASSRGTLSAITSAQFYTMRTMTSGVSGDACLAQLSPAWRF